MDLAEEERKEQVTPCTARDITASAGDLTASAGDITASSGDLMTSAGDEKINFKRSYDTIDRKVKHNNYKMFAWFPLPLIQKIHQVFKGSDNFFKASQ